MNSPRATSRMLPGAAGCPMRGHHSADHAGGTVNIAVDMMDNASGLPACPQRSVRGSKRRKATRARRREPAERGELYRKLLQ
jgi:hypothetical protein